MCLDIFAQKYDMYNIKFMSENGYWYKSNLLQFGLFQK